VQWELIIVGELSVACALLIGFDCYLRHSEIRLLRVSDIALEGDVRSVGGPALTLRFTKSGRPQHVAIRCQIALCLLPRIMKGRGGDTSLFGLKNDRLLSIFKRVQCSLGLDRHLFVVHSLRHGGATHDHVNKVLEMNDIMLRGRWSGLTVTRRYIQDAQALVLMKNLPERVVASVKANVANMAHMFG
jgi:integrase